MIQKQNKKFNNYCKLIDNVIQISRFIDDQKIVNEIITKYYDYFIDVSSLIYTFEEDNNTLGVLCGIINDDTNNARVMFETIDIVNVKQKQFIEFRKRITAGYKSMHTNCEAELEFFSAIEKNKGIGKQLINEFHNDLKSRNISSYYLFTNEICHYQWYIKNGYELVNNIKIDISDLDLILGDQKEFQLFLFKKVINNS